MTLAKNALEISGTVSRIFAARNVRRLRAATLGAYPVSRTTASTRRRVSSDTCSGRLNTRDTVAVETPASAATSMIVGMRVVINAVVGTVDIYPM